VALVLAACVAGVVLSAGGALAQTGTVPAPAPASQQRLKAAIDARYRAFPLDGGVLLVPRRPVAGVGAIEILESTISMNGNVVTGAELRQRLGADADCVIELSYLDPPARRSLLLGPSIAPPLPPPQAEPAPLPQQPPEERVRRRSDARVRIGGPVRIERDEVVNGAVVAVLGSATVEGEVRDDVVVVGGDLRLGPDANVRGDVTVVGGKIDADPKARVGGALNEVGLDIPRVRVHPFDAWGWRTHPFRNWWISPRFDLFAVSLRLLLFGLVSMVLVFAAPRPIRRIERRVAAEPWKSGLVGLLAQLVLVPLLVLTIVILIVSIIGIPLLLLIPFALLALLFALLLGFAGVAARVGGWAQVRFGLSPPNRAVTVLLGLVAIWLLTLVGHLVALGGWAVWGLAAVFAVVGFLVEYLAWTVGFGAALLTRFGTRPQADEAAIGAEPDLGPPPPVDSSLIDVNLK
jgi:hypothetical protein